MISKVKHRLASDEGFTLIELLVVIVILGILLAIAVPSYLGFKDRANKTAAQANVRAAVPSVEAYYSDNGTYAGMTLAALQAIDAGIKATPGSAGDQTATSYCISATSGSYTYSKTGPSGAITAAACP
jgi:type IV pilus assembly protein PilA